eukprot:6789167-Pyramimonas_sp.AAC.2
MGALTCCDSGPLGQSWLTEFDVTCMWFSRSEHRTLQACAHEMLLELLGRAPGGSQEGPERAPKGPQDRREQHIAH